MTAINMYFTLDFELGWGVAENGLWKNRESEGVYDSLHKQFPEVIGLFDRFEVPVTWATVGAMIEPDDVWDFEHLPDLAKSYLVDFTSRARATTLHGRKLFEQVLAAGSLHRIGCHSYSHVRFNFPGMSDSVVERDLFLVRELLQKYGAGNTSLVLPQNIASHLDGVASSGVCLCRTAPLDRVGNRYIRKLNNSCGVFPASQSWREKGMQLNSGSQFFNSPPGKLHAAYLLWLLKRHTVTAIAAGHDMHFWAHPFNFTLNPALPEVANRYFAWLAPFRSRGEIRCIHWADQPSGVEEAAA